MPEWNEEIRKRLVTLGLEPAREDEIVEELSQHLDLRFCELLSRGATKEEAARATLVELNDSELLVKELRRTEPRLSRDPVVLGAGRRNMIGDLWQDLRYGVRMLRKNLAFTAISVLTLTLGIGANTAIFSVVNSVLLNPLPLPEPDRLILMNEAHVQSGEFSVAWPNFLDWRERANSFDDIAGFRSGSFNMTGLDKPIRLSGRAVTWNFPQVLGIQPQLGRSFTPEDDKFGAEPTALISNALWKSAFGADPQVLGRTFTVDGMSCTVIGVLPADFEFLRPDDLWIPLGLSLRPQSVVFVRGNHTGIFALARLKQGVTVEQAQAEMKSIAAQLEGEYPDSNSGNTAAVRQLQAYLVAEIRPALLVLMGAVGFVLLIACVNVANLLLARATTRQQEIAVRLALGARRARLVRQLLTESVLLAALSGVAGVLVGKLVLGGLLVLAPSDLPRLSSVELNGKVMAFTAGLSLLTGLLFGLLPALQASRVDLNTTLKQGGRSPAPGSARRRMFNSLLVVEVSLAVLLLTGAGLMARSVYKLIRVDPGFTADNLLSMRINLTGPKYQNPASRLTFYTESISRIEAMPGVSAAALTQSLPIQGSEWNSVFIVEDQPVPERAHLPNAAFTPISTGYFQTLGIQLLAGRMFNEADNEDTPQVVIINETAARHFWPDQQALGKRLKQGFPESTAPWREVIGVVADVKLEGLAQQTPMQIYLPVAQNSTSSFNLVARTETEPTTMASSIQAVIHTIDPDLPVYQIRSMNQVLERSIMTRRATMVLLGGFATLAVVLAAVGIYGVISYGVIQRTREIGLRMALGAEPGQVMRLILRQGMSLILAGVSVGLIGAFALTRVISSMLFEVSATDPITFVGVPFVLTAIALLACYLPARRAMRVDPMAALRCE